MSLAKEILIKELEENNHEEKVEDVIFWALESYCQTEPKDTWGRIIAYSIKQRILDAEKNDTVIEPKKQ